MLRFSIPLAVLLCTGCTFLPEIAHQPTMHNPFPQLSKVAVVPFFNLSTEKTVDGRQFALAYFNELQLVPGFEVVPVGVAERAMQEHRLTLTGPNDARRLAQILGVDAVAIGAVTDYCAYYPPRCAIQVEWYAANPGFHPIPPGYGLPWGTPEEKDIPAPLVYEAELALAKAQLATQTPACPNIWSQMSAAKDQPPSAGAPKSATGEPGSPTPPSGTPTFPAPDATPPASASPAPSNSSIPTESPAAAVAAGAVVTTGGAAAIAPSPPGMPPNWPDPRGFLPPPPSSQPAACWPSDAPVLRHTQAYNGNDTEFTEALASYYFFRDDARFGGWQSYLQRSDDFIRFCCHLHIWEMLSARGGAGETRVVWRWPSVR